MNTLILFKLDFVSVIQACFVSSTIFCNFSEYSGGEIKSVSKTNSGNYTCVPSYVTPDWILVHITEG